MASLARQSIRFVDHGPRRFPVVGDFAEDTAVHGADGRYTATLSDDWEIWGPAGGYVGTVALRAAGAESRFRRPANCTIHFLGVAAFDEVQLDVEVVRATRRAESIRVLMRQGDRPILQLICWAVADDLPGLDHAHGGHDLDPWTAYPTVEEHLARLGQEPNRPFRFWENLEERPVVWFDDWENRPPSDPVWQSWIRFTPTSTFDDPWVDAGRLLLLADLGPWPAAARLHRSDEWIAPTLDVSCQFDHLDPGAEWLLVDHHAPIGRDGLIGANCKIWSPTGDLLATSVSQLLCTPARR